MKFAQWVFMAVLLLMGAPTPLYGQQTADLPKEVTVSMLDRKIPTPVPTPPPDISLSLKAAIDIALEQNPNLRQARNSLEAADANFDLSRSPYRTMIDVGGSANSRYTKFHQIAGSTVLNPTRSAEEGRSVFDFFGRHGTRSQDRQDVSFSQTITKTFRNATRLQFQTSEQLMQDSLAFFDDDTSKSHDLQNSAQVSYTIPFNSRSRLSIRTNLENAELSYEQALNNLYLQREQVIYQVKVSYWNLQLSEAQLQIRRDDLAQRRWTYEYYQIQHEYGFVPELFVKQARVSMRGREASLLDLDATVRSRYENFNLLLGLPVDYRVGLTESLEVPKVDRSPEEYVKLALSTNLQVKNFGLGIDQMENSLAVTKLGRQPNVDLVNSYSRDDGGDSFANFRFQVSWPFGDGGATKARTRASKSRIEEQRIGLWDLERGLRQQVMQLVRDIETAQRQLEINEESVMLATEALDTANFQFENGQIDFRDLQAAQIDLANSRVSLEVTKFNLHLALANLESMIHEY